MVAWYVDVLSFSDGYRYASLETESGIRIGIAPAAEVGVEPSDRANNSVLLKIEVADVQLLFERLREAGVAITFGPSLDESGKF